MNKLSALFLSLALLLFTACNRHEVTSLVLSNDALVMRVGESRQLEAIILPLSSSIYNIVYWKSSDYSVASVDYRGNVTAVYSGSCTITATCGDLRATCVVSVGALDYEVDFSHAIAYYYGNYYGENTENTILRLLDDGLTVGVDGVMQGAGLFLNLDINTPQNGAQLTGGKYVKATGRDKSFSFAAGNFIEENNALYVVGSFLGSYQPNGLGVVLVEDSTFSIEQAGADWRISGVLIGNRAERIAFSYLGSVAFQDMTTPPPDTLKLRFNTQTITSLGDVYGSGHAVYRVVLESGTYRLQLECYAIQSTSELPQGVYALGSEPSLFTLRPSDTVLLTGTLLFDNAVPVALHHGSAQITKHSGIWTVNCSFVDVTGRIVTGQ
ncbi:MAG: Ig-like domain-containing protein [Prevotellaceae bacterium]|jgi:hypothetical protein|nr:Ig-like domain-containing protein [Prevotellaceae bacterium]